LIYIVAVYHKDSTTRDLYVNGEYIDTDTSGSVDDYSDVVAIGKNNYISIPFGLIALVLIYNQALSESKIKHNLHNPSNPIREGLVLWLDARNVIGDTWYDLSPYKNHGTLYNGATQVSLPNPPMPAGV